MHCIADTASPAPQLSAGSYHTCAARKDASLRCAGEDMYTKTLIPDSRCEQRVEVPRQLWRVCATNSSFLGYAVRVAAVEPRGGEGAHAACCFVADHGGHVAQLRAGLADTGRKVSVWVLTTPTTLSSGRPQLTLCACRCWGQYINGEGGEQQGTDPSGNPLFGMPGPFKEVCACLPALPARTHICDAAAGMQIHAGVDFTCALRTDGTLECWGRNNHGQVCAPNGTEQRSPLPPTADSQHCRAGPQVHSAGRGPQPRVCGGGGHLRRALLGSQRRRSVLLPATASLQPTLLTQ